MSDYCATVIAIDNDGAAWTGSPYSIGVNDTLVDTGFGLWAGQTGLFSVGSIGDLTENFNNASTIIPMSGGQPVPGTYVIPWQDDSLTIQLTAGACGTGGSGGGPNDPTHLGQMMMGDSMSF